MRITFVLPTFNLSGGIRVAAIYAERLQRRGHKVLAVAPRDDPPTLKQSIKSFLRGHGWPRQGREPSHFDGGPVEHHLLPHPGPVTDADVPDADVVIASWWETVEWVAALSPSKGAKVHFVQHYEIYAGEVDRVNAAYALPMPKIVISTWLQDIIQNQFHQTPAAFIPNSIDPEQFFAPPRGKQPVPTVGMLYHTLPLKGADIALKAYELAVKDIPNLRLVAMGDWGVMPSLPMPKGAEFVLQARGQTLRDTYSGCDVWLFASRLEGFGLPILEAMACRTPVIGTPAGAAPYLLGKGGGILVPAEDPAAMAKAIVQVCSLPEADWRRLSDAALAITTEYTWEDATNLMEETLHKVAQQSAGST